MTVFYCITRLGEFIIKTIQDFTLTKHVTCCNMLSLRDQNGLPVLQFTLPVTKCEPENRKNVQCAPQTGCITDPEVALRNHLCVNQAPDSAHLFTWKHPKGGLRPLSKTQFMSCIAAIVK